MRRHFAGVTRPEWNDWRWQLRNRIRDSATAHRVLCLTAAEQAGVVARETRAQLPLGITPYYASVLDAASPGLRRTVIPLVHEQLRLPGESDDPLGEDGHSPVPGLVHRYPDRVLLLASGFCSTYCRYCTRSRLVGGADAPASGRRSWDAAINYIANNRGIRDVLISGGDPLTMTDARLDDLLTRLRAIRHVEIVRIGTKVPAVLPQRITPQLVRMLKRHHPLWMSLHFTHPDELTTEATRACGRLADAGIPLGSQTVLLAGVNDSVEVMRELVHGLLQTRVRPYYLYQCDPISGSAHFRTPVERGIEIVAGLRGHTSGYAVPTFVIDAPGGGGKVPVGPEHLVGRDGDDLMLRNFEGRIFRYPDATAPMGSSPGE
jgi:lysine 2,3-aminomutase